MRNTPFSTLQTRNSLFRRVIYSDTVWHFWQERKTGGLRGGYVDRWRVIIRLDGAGQPDPAARTTIRQMGPLSFRSILISRITSGVDPRCRGEPRMRKHIPGTREIGTVRPPVPVRDHCCTGGVVFDRVEWRRGLVDPGLGELLRPAVRTQRLALLAHRVVSKPTFKRRRKQIRRQW